MLMRMFKEFGGRANADKVNITATPFYKAVTISRQYHSWQWSGAGGSNIAK